jgi:hypothetical protein
MLYFSFESWLHKVLATKIENPNDILYSAKTHNNNNNNNNNN